MSPQHYYISPVKLMPCDIIPPMAYRKKRLNITPDNEETFTLTINRSQLYIILIPLVFLVGLGTGYLAWGREVSREAAQAPQGQTIPQVDIPQNVQRYDIEIFEDDPVLGPEDAPVTIFEFSDFECPFCRRHNLEVFNRILEAYEGQIRYVYKDFPLTSIHPNALPAAAAALCAHEQDAFWEFHGYLFSMALGLSEEAYMQYAEDLNLDMDDFTECVEEGRYEESVQADIDFASSLGVRSTPTFFINGIAVVGAQDFEVFVQVIDGELAGGD